MRILHVVQRYAPAIGGSERYFQELSERFAARGHQVTVFTTDALDIDRFWSPSGRKVDASSGMLNGVRVQRFPVRRLPVFDGAYHRLRWLALLLSRWPMLEPANRLLASCTPLLPEFALRLAFGPLPFDLIHAGCTPYDSLMLWASFAARRKRIPFVITPFTHLGDSADADIRRHYTMPQQIRLLRDADAVFVQTALEAAFLTAKGVPRRAIHRGGAGIEPEQLAGGDAERFRAKHGVRGPIVTFIGVQLPDKGALHLLEAMRCLWEHGSDAVLAVAGAPTEAFDVAYSALPDEYKARCPRLGKISDAEKNDLLAASTVLALPSRTESFGIVYFEAWYYGVPVIGSAAGAPSEVIENGTTGLLAPFGEVAGLAAAIQAILDDPVRAKAMGEAGRAKALGGYTWEQVTDRVGAVYGDLLAGPW